MSALSNSGGLPPLEFSRWRKVPGYLIGGGLVLCVIGELLVVGGPSSSSLAGNMGSDLLYHIALPLAGILVLLRVPRIMDTMLGAMGSRLVGATAIVDGAAGVASSVVMSAATGAATRAIRLGGRP